MYYITRTPNQLLSDNNYITVPTYLFSEIPEVGDKVRIEVPEERYEVFAKVARISPKGNHVSLFIDTWSYNMLYDENEEDEPKAPTITPKQALDLMEPVTYTKADMARAWDEGLSAAWNRHLDDWELKLNPYK